MKLSRWVILVVVGLAVVAGVVVGVGKRQAWLKKLKIGWIGPLTGPVQLLGVENERAMRMAIEEHNKEGWHQIEFRAEDDGYDAKRSVGAYKKLKDWGANVIFVNTYSAMFHLSKLAKDDGVVLVNSIDNDRELARLDVGNVWLVGKETEDLARILAEDIVKSGVTEVGVVYYLDDDFMPTVALSLRQQLAQQGVGVEMMSYGHTETEFLEVVDGLDAAEAVVFLGYKELGRAMKLVRANLPQAQFYTVNIGMAEAAGEAMEGARLAHFTIEDGNVTLAKKFVADYEKRWGAKLAHAWTAMQGYDAITMVLEACDKIGWGWSWRLFRFSSFSGVTGDIKMDKDGRSEGIEWRLYRYVQGRVEKL